MKIALLEDESIVIRDLKLRINSLGYEIVFAFDNAKDFLHQLDNTNVDLCLVDINIKGDINGIDAVKILQEKHNIPIIYITAQGDMETFNLAKQTKPQAYLLKPYNEFELQASIELAIENFGGEKNENSEKDLHLINDKIFFRFKNRFESIHIKDILYLEASGNYTEIISETNKYLVVTQLGKFESLLNEKFIYRCHRSFLINLHMVDGFDDTHIYIGEKYIPISKTHKKEFLNRLRII